MSETFGNPADRPTIGNLVFGPMCGDEKHAKVTPDGAGAVYVRRLIERAVGSERERCAKIAEEEAGRMDDGYGAGGRIGAAIAARIREGK